MAKKKQPAIQSDLSTNETNTVVVMETPVAVDENNNIYPLNGKAVGVYYDETLKKYVLATLDLSPETNSAIITNKKVLRSSKLGVTLEADMLLKKIIEKEIK